MNIFLRELRAHRKGLIFWCVGMIFLVGSGVAKFYGYNDSGASNITEVLSMFPHSLQVLFGLNGFDLTKPSGAYGILFMYIIVMAAIHAALLGTDLIAKEERDKTAEFVFTKPISRATIITQKLCAGLLNLVILNLVTLATSIYVVGYFSKSTAGTHDVMLMDAALFIIQSVFFFFGAAVAAIVKRPSIATGLATSILLITFVLYFAINLSGNIGYLKYFTPFEYFDARTLIATGRLDFVYLVLSSSLVFIFLFVTYFVYGKRDLHI